MNSAGGSGVPWSTYGSIPAGASEAAAAAGTGWPTDVEREQSMVSGYSNFDVFD